MVVLKMGGEDIVIQRLRAALEGKPIPYSSEKGREEMSRVIFLVSWLLDLQKEDCLNLILDWYIRDVCELLIIFKPEQFKAYYIRKSQERERTKWVRPITVN